MSVFSVRLRKNVKEKMEKYKDRVDWAEEVRRFIGEKLRTLKAESNIRNILEELSKIPIESPKRSSVASLREDRESH